MRAFLCDLWGFLCNFVQTLGPFFSELAGATGLKFCVVVEFCKASIWCFLYFSVGCLVFQLFDFENWDF